MSIDMAAQRRRFATLAHKVYLNSGSYGLLAPEVSQAYAEYLASRERGALTGRPGSPGSRRSVTGWPAC
jgi:hypothetical protein